MHLRCGVQSLLVILLLLPTIYSLVESRFKVLYVIVSEVVKYIGVLLVGRRPTDRVHTCLLFLSFSRVS